MTYVRSMEHGFGTFRLDGLVEVQNGFAVGECARPVCINFVQNLIVLRLHPDVEERCGVIGQLHKNIAHTLGVAVLPKGKLLFKDVLPGVNFTVKVNFTALCGSGSCLAARNAENHHEYKCKCGKLLKVHSALMMK